MRFYIANYSKLVYRIETFHSQNSGNLILTVNIFRLLGWHLSSYSNRKLLETLDEAGFLSQKLFNVKKARDLQ